MSLPNTFPLRYAVILQVCVIGDGKTEPLTIAGNKLKDTAELEKIGAELTMPESVAASRKTLGEKLFWYVKDKAKNCYKCVYL